MPETEIRIRKLDEGYLINDTIAVTSADQMVKRVKALFGVTDTWKGKKAVITPSPPQDSDQILNQELEALGRHNTREKVELLIKHGYTELQMADKLKLSQAAIKYHLEGLKDLDPDADYKPLLNQNTKTDYDGGELGVSDE